MKNQVMQYYGLLITDALEMDYLISENNTFAIKHYRPEYNSNPNLNAQKVYSHLL